MNFADSKSRPVPVLAIGCLYIATGVLGLVFHWSDFERQPFFSESLWIILVELIAAVAGASLLRGHNWARWLAIARCPSNGSPFTSSSAPFTAGRSWRRTAQFSRRSHSFSFVRRPAVTSGAQSPPLQTRNERPRSILQPHQPILRWGARLRPGGPRLPLLTSAAEPEIVRKTDGLVANGGLSSRASEIDFVGR